MPTRLIRFPPRGQLDLLAQHIKQQHAEGRSVLIVTASHPASVMVRHFTAAGVNLARVFVIDAVGSRAGVERSTDLEHLMYVPGPTQLELIAMRAEKIIRQKAQGPPTVLICTLNAFALYNATDTLEELIRYVVHSLARPKAVIDFVVEDGQPLDEGLREFIEGFVDEVIQVGN